MRNLLIDSCFLIEFFVRAVCSRNSSAAFDMRGYAGIGNDLMIIGNQVPFYILNEVFEKTIIPGLNMDLMELASMFFNLARPKEKYPRPNEVQHLLDLIHCCQDPDNIVEEPRQQSYKQMLMLCFKKLMFYLFQPVFCIFNLVLHGRCSPPIDDHKRLQGQIISISATLLLEAGIKLKRKTFDKNYKRAGQLKVTFLDAKLEIPELLVTSSTDTCLRNLIALEMCCSASKFCIPAMLS